LLENPWIKLTGVPKLCRESEPNDDSPYFGAFSSERIPKATKDVKVHFFIHSYSTTDIISANAANFL
jgi:hypothetical protein